MVNFRLYELSLNKEKEKSDHLRVAVRIDRSSLPDVKTYSKLTLEEWIRKESVETEPHVTKVPCQISKVSGEMIDIGICLGKALEPLSLTVCSH